MLRGRKESIIRVFDVKLRRFADLVPQPNERLPLTFSVSLLVFFRMRIHCLIGSIVILVFLPRLPTARCRLLCNRCPRYFTWNISDSSGITSGDSMAGLQSHDDNRLCSRV